MKRLLSSTAALKTLYDNKQYDLYDAFSDFIRYIAKKKMYETFSSLLMQSDLKCELGLDIPLKTIEALCSKMIKSHELSKRDNKYHVNHVHIDVSSIDNMTLEMCAQIEGVVACLSAYILDTHSITVDASELEDQLLSFIDYNGADFFHQVSCGGGYSGNHHDNRIFYCIATWLLEQSKVPSLYYQQLINIFLGRVISNAISGIDSMDRKHKFTNTTFYFDSPLILEIIGTFGSYNETSTTELTKLLLSSSASIAIYQHTFDEVRSVLDSIENKLRNNYPVHGDIGSWVRKHNIKQSDISLLKNDLEEILKEKKIVIHNTPHYDKKFQVNETQLGQMMQDKGLRHIGQNGKSNDINSIRSVYVLRGRHIPRSIEDSRAIFVTHNSALQRVSFEYSVHHEQSKHVPAIVTSFYLTNYLWVKFPSQASTISEKRFLASCFSLTMPDESFYKEYIEQLDRLKSRGTITERQYHVARWDFRVQEKIVDITLNETSAISENTIQRLLNEYQLEIAAPVLQELEVERAIRESKEAETEAALVTVGITTSKLESMGVNVQNFATSLNQRIEKLSCIVSWGVVSLLFIPVALFYINIDFLKAHKTPFFSILVGYFVVAGFVSTFWGPALFTPFIFLQKKINKALTPLLKSIFKVDELEKVVP